MFARLKNLLGLSTKADSGRIDRAGSRPSRTRASFRPNLEILEERLALSASGTITSIADSYSTWRGGVNHQYAIRPGAGYPGGTLTEAKTYEILDTSVETGFPYYLPSYVYYPVTTGWTNHDGPQLKQISAGLDSRGKAECFGLDLNGSVWVYQTSGWHNLGGWASSISASYNDKVYAVGYQNYLYVRDTKSDWQPLFGPTALAGGPERGVQVSVGRDITPGTYAQNQPAKDDLWVRDMHNAVWSLDSGGWHFWRGFSTQISATAHGGVYAIGGANAIYFHEAAGDWVFTGGHGSAISAGTDLYGANDRLFQIGLGSDHGIYEFSQHGPQQGWEYVGGYAREIAGCEWAGGLGSVMLIGGEGAAWWHSHHTGPSGNLWNYEGYY